MLCCTVLCCVRGLNIQRVNKQTMEIKEQSTKWSQLDCIPKKKKACAVGTSIGKWCCFYTRGMERGKQKQLGKQHDHLYIFYSCIQLQTQSTLPVCTRALSQSSQNSPSGASVDDAFKHLSCLLPEIRPPALRHRKSVRGFCARQ